MEKNAKIFVAGDRGLVGSAILKQLKEKGYTNIITRTRTELDLVDCIEVSNFFSKIQPDYVFVAAAKVGGIVANNKYRADFIYENLMIQTNIIHHSYLNKVKKLLFLGSTCIYPKNCRLPIKEEYLLTGEIEYTNEPYAIAKIAGIKMCESYNLQYGTNFISVMPTNLYGPKDNYNLETSHVLPAILRKIYLAKALEENDWEKLRDDLGKRPIDKVNSKSSDEEILEVLKKYGISLHRSISEDKIFSQVEIWGSGNALREFLWSEDMAEACIYIMENINFSDLIPSGPNVEVRNTHLNIGTGKEISIGDLARLIKQILGYNGELYFNSQKPEGTPRKVTDSSKLLKMGWKASVSLEEGIGRMLKELNINNQTVITDLKNQRDSA
ncbi:GDP-L-fucose synthase [Gillisia mitskevichiae]|uniref:GDP-L-fucose synthase n=1 Tax=Gillisia mitskevichiae TaxID=270921 RepID=A0A495P5B2_9FLAO|nr:GDP-L-fucose synthase [Gillisia mitskevichiae]RKS45185.1 GDP-L-fucose synthase [Gillisia mitskevichiae]